MIRNYFKIAFRSFKKHKLFTFINVIGLSIGISAAVVIFLIVNYDFSFDKFHKDSGRIYRVVTDFSFAGNSGYNCGVTGPMPEAVRNEVTGVESSAPFFTLYDFSASIPDGSKSPKKFNHEQSSVLADGRYFNMFQYKWLVGSASTSLNGPYQVVLTSEQAKNYFPSLSYQQMLGKEIVFEDTLRTTVTGVVETLKQNSDLTFKDFISYSTIKSSHSLQDQVQPTEWGSTTSASQFIVKLSPGSVAANIEKQVNALYKKHNPPKPEDKGSTTEYRLQPLSDLHFNSKYGSFDSGSVANKSTLYGLLFIAAFLLILGCINFINLTTAQASQRAKEIGIRKTMGSSRGQLIGQFLSETFLVTLFAVIISIVLAPFILKIFSDFISKSIRFDPLGHPVLMVFILGLTVLVSFIAGFYPSMVLSNFQPVQVLKNQAFSGSSKTRSTMLRKSLTVTQFIIAQFFIIATILVSKQIYYALHKDLGFKKDAILYVTTPYKNNTASKKQVFLAELKALPQIELISIGNAPPSSGGTNSTTVTYKDGKKEIKTDLEIKYGDENYIKLYKIKMLAGRDLTVSDTSGQMVINNTFVKALGFKTPQQAIGKLIDRADKPREVIGVVADFYQKSLRAPIRPLAIVYHPVKYNNNTFHIALKPQTAGGNEWKAAIAGMEKTWKQLYPDNDFQYQFYDESIARFYESERHTSKLLGWATGLAILISCLGLLGLAMYTTGLRTKEIGVRKVLGATVSQIVTLLSKELILLVLLAFIIVTPLSWWALQKLFLQNFADKTSLSWWVFALSGTGMLAVALITLSFQTIKAAIANPVKSLRSE